MREQTRGLLLTHTNKLQCKKKPKQQLPQPNTSLFWPPPFLHVSQDCLSKQLASDSWKLETAVL